MSYAVATFADENVKNGDGVSIAGISISGPDAGNYNLLSTTASTSANISPAPLTITATSDAKTYDGAVNSSRRQPTKWAGCLQARFFRATASRRWPRRSCRGTSWESVEARCSSVTPSMTATRRATIR